ncbi:uncharacterized protein LOC128736372 [Sabethes cyaneus]|uniref:uncharacterized protein LOC128736372 n=1 Tax=Sabethes cyaneus TaxID=53552 RepID=UPI00237D5E93|nr:uncharacterized protein LOC128736372 [Sabethes cyaneus]
MQTVVFPVLRKKYAAELYAAEQLHLAAAEANVDRMRDLLANGANCYKPVKDGETALHVAIWNQQADIYAMLLDIYERDFAVIEQKCHSLGKDKWWLKKTIPVACTEEQCKRARDLEVLSSNEEFNEENVELVFLNRTCELNQTALIHVNAANREQIQHFIKSLAMNGFISWNNSGFDQRCDTFLQLAVFRGDISLIRRLISNGAHAGQSGRKNITPLMEACSTQNFTVTKMLFEEFGDQLDPTVLDSIGYSALTHLLPRCKADIFDYVLQKIVAYRRDKLQETETEAFNRTFRYEHRNWPELSIWSMTDDRSRATYLVQYLKRYKYDLSFRSGYQVMLMELITRHTAEDYYQAEIRREPKLLELEDPEGCNVLHCLLWSDELEFVKELYEVQPDYCRTVFERDTGAVICLASVMTHCNCSVLIFLLNRHLEFIGSIADRMLDSFYEEELIPPGMFDEPVDILVEYLPQLASRIDDLKYKVMEEEMEMMLEDVFFSKSFTPEERIDSALFKASQRHTMDSDLFPCVYGLSDSDDDASSETPRLIEYFEYEQGFLEKLTNFEINFYQPEKEGTLLHRSIWRNQKRKFDDLIQAYQLDFNRVRNYLVSKFDWNTNDKVWLRKTILVAVDKDHCVEAKTLENLQISNEDISRAVFVLLKTPIEGEEVAVIHPCETNRLAVFHLINKLIPNGQLTWNSIGKQTNETPIEVAASCGNILFIDRLYGLGAEIAFHEHSALITACRYLQKDVIYWLLTEHFDHFDCTLRDDQQYNAIILLMQKHEEELFEFVLEKMITYRQKYYHESESEAFNAIIRFEHKDYAGLSIFMFVPNGPMLHIVEKYIVKYKLDLAYQWEEVTILSVMLNRKIALEYCFDEIRKNPSLLELVDYDCTTVLHSMVTYGYTDFLRVMYITKPELKTYFETDGGINVLKQALFNGNCEQLQFIFDNHLQFVKSRLEDLRQLIYQVNSVFLSTVKDLILNYFPELRKDAEDACQPKPEYHSSTDLEWSFNELCLDMSSIPVKLQNSQSPKSIRGKNGETLLHLAADKDDAIFFVEMLESDCDLTVVDNDGNHPVHFVRSLNMLNLLIDRHPEGDKIVHYRNANDFTVLHYVCSRYMERESRLHLVQRIVDYGVDVNLLNNQGETILFLLLECGPLDILLKHNIKLDVINKRNETALLHQARNGNVYVTTALLPMCVDLPSFKANAYEYLTLMMNSRSRDTFTCEYQGFLKNYPEITKLLFDSLYQHSREEASKIFTKACSGAFNFVVEKFLDYDYDLNYNYADEHGYTPIIGLLSYMEEKNDHLVKRLLEKGGIDLEARSNRGQNALLSFASYFRSAQWHGHNVETVQLLLDYGSNINAADDDENTALHIAFSTSEKELVEMLVRQGGNLKAVNKSGKIPCQMGGKVDQELFYFMV